MGDPLFLTKDQVLNYHSRQIQIYGGDVGIRDDGLLDSALAQPENSYLYDLEADVFDLAATYAFHISKNHPFVDGNKRTALQAALAFLKQNKIEIGLSSENLYDLMMRLTTSQIGKKDFGDKLFRNSTAEVNFSDVDYSEVARIADSIKDRPNISKGEITALFIDYITSKDRSFVAERCDELCINPKRFEGDLVYLEKMFFSMVPEKLRQQFGMRSD